MSYIIPNNSKSSIILYLDSRDATSYLAQNSDNIDLFSYFQYVLTENIEVPLNQRALVSLNSATIPYSFYNIRDGVNDIVKVSIGGVEKSFDIPAGNYTAYSLATVIEEGIVDEYGGVVNSLTMEFDSDLQKYNFTFNCDDAFVIKFLFDNTLASAHTELGFRAEDVTLVNSGAAPTLSKTTSQNVVDINGSIHGVYIRSNLVSKGTLDSQNGTLSNILARLPINVQSGGIIFGEQSSHKSVVDLRYINTVTIRLTDERNRILDLNGLHFQIAIAIDFIYAQKPVNIPTGSLSENPELSFHNEEKMKRRDSKIKKTLTKEK